MLKALSRWLATMAAPAPCKPDPDGHELAALLFAMPDPIDAMSHRRSSLAAQACSTSTQSSEPTPGELRDCLLESTSLFFVARPESLRKLRESGHMRAEPSGTESAFLGSSSIPFFGYAEAPMDDLHWGLELRRISSVERVDKDLHALREDQTQLLDEGLISPAKRSKGSGSPRI
jgi:hypothetical protein